MGKILVRNMIGDEKIYATEASDPEVIKAEVFRWWAMPGVTKVQVLDDEE
jgi:hypothetical protein